ncbi:NADAR domain-containing protein [Jiella sonneratiae]|uniref:NADAR family protein n=1 Tax=Jiella sonneratiae TaxID=2816856 RepID=A0ABS3IY40_9HYPH|nr:NADAR family protein [Jiella sonneratiae]
MVVDGATLELVAFYYPGSNTPWDDVYDAPFLGNFWLTTVTMTVGGTSGTFHTAEAAFQATKWWHDAAARQAFENAPDGDAAYHVKRQLQRDGVAPDYGYAGLGRDGAMRHVLAAKFSGKDLADGLIETKEAYLLEHNARTGRDDYWSDNADGTGRNMLGLMLMALRSDLGGCPDPAPNAPVADFTRQVEN